MRYHRTGGKDISVDARNMRPFLNQGGGDTYQVKVSDDDTTPGYLSGKITSADTSVVIAVANDAADEDLDLSVAVYVAAEIATHAADVDAHHAPVTQGYGIIVTGQQVAIDTSVIAEVSDLHTAVTLSTDANNNLLSLSGQVIGLDSQSANVIFAGPSTGGAAAPAFRALVDADIPASIARDTELHDAVTLAADAGAILGLTGQQITLDTQSANTLFAGPTSGGAADPTFRALVDADIPSSIARDSEVTSAISTHTADPDAHHDQAHVLATTSALGPDHAVSGLTARQVLIATGASTALFRALEDADIPASIARDSEVTTAVSTHAADADAHHNWPLLDADIPSSIARDSEVTAAISSHASDANAHHNRSHAITSGSDHTVTGAALDVVGLTTTNTLGILTPSSAPGAASAILKSTGSGGLTLASFSVSGAAGASRDMYLQTAGSLRWVIRANDTAESGSNTGSDFQLIARTDAGAALVTAMQVTRATGYVNFPGTAVQASSLGVGISPSVPAHIYGAGELVRLQDSGTTNPYLSFYVGGVRRSYILQHSTNYNALLVAAYGGIEMYTGTGGTAALRATIDSAGDVALSGSLTIDTNGNQGDRFLMENSNVSGSSVFYDFNQSDRDAGSTGAFEAGFYRDANNITQFRMSKEVFEIIIKSGGTFRFPLEVRAQQVILAELPTSNPGIVGALYRSGGTVLIST